MLQLLLDDSVHDCETGVFTMLNSSPAVVLNVVAVPV